MRATFRLTPLLCAALAGAAAAAPAPKPAPAAAPVKGQGQLAGGNGQFGTVMTLDNGFNFEILSARYTLDPFVANPSLTAGTDQKLLVLEIAIKNAKKDDNWFNPEGAFTLVDEKGQLYPGGDFGLESRGSADTNLTLRPGQGLGQPELKDPLRVAFQVPGSARIVKIMLNHARLGRKEEVVRYYVAGATKAEAGEDGDPKNVIAPLPEEARDPADKSGAVAAESGKGIAHTFHPSGSFAIRLDAFAYSSDPIGDSAPDEGKRFAIATVTVKCLTDTALTMFDVTGGDAPLYQITDSDGEREKPSGYRKAKRDEDPEHEFKRGDEYTFRVLFTLPKDATAKKLVLGTGQARTWTFDPADVK